MPFSARRRAVIAPPKPLPITHLVVLVQENHSFDSYFGRFGAATGLDTDGFPADFANPDGAGHPLLPHAATSSCLNMDPPHQWYDAHLAWNEGHQDGFVRSGGSQALTYYQAAQMPFYYWLASTFSIAIPLSFLLRRPRC